MPDAKHAASSDQFLFAKFAKLQTKLRTARLWFMDKVQWLLFFAFGWGLFSLLFISDLNRPILLLKLGQTSPIIIADGVSTTVDDSVLTDATVVGNATEFPADRLYHK